MYRKIQSRSGNSTHRLSENPLRFTAIRLATLNAALFTAIRQTEGDSISEGDVLLLMEDCQANLSAMVATGRDLEGLTQIEGFALVHSPLTLTLGQTKQELTIDLWPMTCAGDTTDAQAFLHLIRQMLDFPEIVRGVKATRSAQEQMVRKATAPLTKKPRAAKKVTDKKKTAESKQSTAKKKPAGEDKPPAKKSRRVAATPSAK